MKENELNIEDIHAPLVRKSYFRFYEELNDFLPKEWKKTIFPFPFYGTPSVKNTIESIGIPHAEIDLILVNGVSVGFEFLLQGEEQISVYPVFETFDISPVLHLHSKPLRKTRFIADVNLGKLAKKMRLLGFDTLFRNDYGDNEIVEISEKEKRIILTRDKGVLKHTRVTHGYWLRNNDPKLQLVEVIEKLHLQSLFKPFSRCSNCNGIFSSIEKEKINGRVPRDTIQFYDKFWQCKDCNQIYWEGSHFEKINKWVHQLTTGF